MNHVTRVTNLITLSYRSVPSPQGRNDGWTCFVGPYTDTFSPRDYAEVFSLNVHDIDAQTIKSVQDAVNNNFGGTSWIEVTHETETTLKGE